MSTSSITHLQSHHGDFGQFRDVMIQTAPARFGPIWWGIWDQLVVPDGCPAPRSVLDLGSGPGGLLPGLRQRLPDAELTAVELQPAMLEALQPLARRLGAQVVEADLAAPIPLPSTSFDVVTAVMVLHELVFPPALMEEIARLLSPGGTLVLYDWVRRPLEDYLGDEALTPDVLQHFREHCLYTSDDLAFLCRRVGLDVIESVGRRDNRYAVIVARKPAP